jgi:hypothetical protein
MSVFQYGSLIQQVATTVTSGGTTILVNTSPTIQVFTGSTTQTVQLPVATTFTKAGISFQIYNQSTGIVTVHYQDASSFQTIPSMSSLTVNLVNNGTANGSWTALTNSSTPSLNAPTVQKFLSGSGTYTTPVSPSPLYIKVTMVGGGGGGGGGDVSGASVGGNGVNGGNTTFGTSLLSAGGGQGGTGGGSGLGDGGASSLGSGPIGIALTGGSGGAPGVQVDEPTGGMGGGSAFGGAGGNGPGSSGSPFNAAANTGGGGGGGGGTGTVTNGGSGGGAGGYVSAIINSPASTYAYAVGSGGTGGTSGFAGGAAGGSGMILVEEFYQ